MYLFTKNKIKMLTLEIRNVLDSLDTIHLIKADVNFNTRCAIYHLNNRNLFYVPIGCYNLN